MASLDKVKVVVRVRPFNRREIDLGTKCVVDMESFQTVLYHPSTGVKDSENHGSKKAPKSFAFDHCFWSMDENNPKFSSQAAVFNCLGRDVLERAFEGYNACIFAYGQTGSGKSYTMMGTLDNKGIIPRLCEGMFESIAKNNDQEVSFKVEVSYMEIYNEKVRDLLDPKGKHNLRVREHNILGPYVDGLSTLAVSSFEDIDNLMSEGNKSRTVAATNMNSESSRSHAVFNIILTQTLTDEKSGVSGEKVSKMSLVDLAGSERAQKTGAVGERLKEGSNINKSLTTLGLVISALADSGSKNKQKFVPYRDSVLTWLLKDNLGGNSKTVMVATLSPAADNYEETLSTLRYADRAKRIVNHAIVNEDPNARIIRELREEVEQLRKMLSEAQSAKPDDLKERLQESEKLMKDMGKTWEEKLKETERIHQERHATLEKMGISVQTSGIKVEQGKYYLVNLNADPSLNELLVYYLKEHTLVGRPDAPKEQDIQLSGLGIMSEHCIVDIKDLEVYITPLEGARTCVNGRTITEQTKLKHGDRLLWGNNHFFRVNCPKSNSPTSETPENIDYEFAQAELMMQQMGNDPIQEAIESIEKQHEEDKQEALDKQRNMYERQMQMLRNQLMSPSTPSNPYLPVFPDPFSKMGLTPTGSSPSNMHPKYQQWAQEREKLFKQSLSKLKEEVVKANALIREANVLAQEMGKQTEFSVTLQIPAANLSPNRKRGAFVSEPAILVKRKNRGSQVWSMEKFENKIIDMRDMYEERKEKGLPMMVDDNDEERVVREGDEGPPMKGDPFYESQENHNLIGVANVFLEALFYDVKLDYHVPIVSQQGEVAGRLHIELCRVAGTLPERVSDDLSSESSGESSRPNSFIEMDDETGVAIGSTIVCRVCIKEAKGLPPALSNFVFCQYTYWGYPEPIVVPPIVDPDTMQRKKTDGMSFRFDHKKEFTVHVTEEFMEHCLEGALSIEVWGHRSVGLPNTVGDWEIDQVQAKSRSIMDRWSELTRKIEMWVEIHELSEQGEYTPVEVLPKPEVLTGGVFQLRQGHSRRLLVRVKPVQNSGTLPIICESITHLSIGCVCARSKLQKGLDSYQEEDLALLREKWSDALEKRREYLDEQLQRIMNKEDKTEADTERERSLIDQWVCLTEERNAVLVPAASSGIPGAPADWEAPLGMEEHIPVIFLDLNAEDMSTPNVKEGLQAAGMNSILPKEHGAKFYTLPFVKNSDKDVCAIVSWDSSIHDSVHLNRVTPNNERVYLILKVVVRLSHPASMELVLRKRICINVYKRQSITEKLKKKIGKAVWAPVTGSEYFQDNLIYSGITYEIVSNIPKEKEAEGCGVLYEIVYNLPKASEELEDRESLAQIAASQNEQHTADGETYIEKYIKGVSAVESILTLDRLRQDVAIKELLASRGRPQSTMRKATSVPNIHNILSSPRGMDDSLRSDSTQDLRDKDRFGTMPKNYTVDSFRHSTSSGDIQKDNFFSKDTAGLPNKPTGPFSLASPKTGMSPQPKLMKPLTTLVEEQRECKPLLKRNPSEDSDEDEFAKLKEEQETLKKLAEIPEPQPPKPKSPGPENNSANSIDSDDFQEFQAFQGETKDPAASVAKPEGHGGGKEASSIPHSSTSDSLADVPAKSFTPSMSSSGYGSQAVSTQTLSSEDSSSVRSMSIDDTPENGEKNGEKNAEKNAEKSGDKAKMDSNILKAHGGNGDKTDSKVLVENSVSVPSNVDNSAIDGSKLTAPSAVDGLVDLMDSKVPSNLNSPIKPVTTPQAEAQEVGDSDEVLQVSVAAKEADVQTTTENSTKQTPESKSESNLDDISQSSEQNTSAQEPDSKSELQAKNNSGTTSSEKCVTDFYSENAMEELENLSDEGERAAVDTETKPEPQLTNHTAQEKVKLRKSASNGTEEKTARRRSWAEKDGRQPSIWEEPYKTGQTEVKLRKGGSIDVGRAGSVKSKIRAGDKQGVKSSPSPMKATYRPVSMPLEMLEVLAMEEAELGSQDGSREDLNNSDNEDTMSVCSFGSRADLHRLGEVAVPGWIQVSEPVLVLFSQGGTKPGTVMFVGQTDFASGNWIGVELDQPEGKNDGSVKGVRYFKCRKRHGVFVRHDKIIMDKKRRSSVKGAKQSSLRRSTGNLAAGSPGKDSGKDSPSYLKGTAASSSRKTTHMNKSLQ